MNHHYACQRIESLGQFRRIEGASAGTGANNREHSHSASHSAMRGLAAPVVADDGASWQWLAPRFGAAPSLQTDQVLVPVDLPYRQFRRIVSTADKSLKPDNWICIRLVPMEKGRLEGLRRPSFHGKASERFTVGGILPMALYDRSAEYRDLQYIQYWAQE
jgi:hypothetical protein